MSSGMLRRDISCRFIIIIIINDITHSLHTELVNWQMENNGDSALSGLTDWLIELWFYVPLDIKQVISETFPLQADLLAWYGEN